MGGLGSLKSGRIGSGIGAFRARGGLGAKSRKLPGAPSFAGLDGHMGSGFAPSRPMAPEFGGFGGYGRETYAEEENGYGSSGLEDLGGLGGFGGLDFGFGRSNRYGSGYDGYDESPKGLGSFGLEFSEFGGFGGQYDGDSGLEQEHASGQLAYGGYRAAGYSNLGT